MDDKDLKQIKDLFKQEFKTGFRESLNEFWDGNLEPAFTDIHKDIANLPTKTFLTDKLANLEGDLVKKLRKEDEKINRLAEILKDKNILTELDIQELGNLQVFPK